MFVCSKSLHADGTTSTVELPGLLPGSSLNHRTRASGRSLLEVRLPHDKDQAVTSQQLMPNRLARQGKELIEPHLTVEKSVA